MFAAFASSVTKADTLKLSSLNWPPYSGPTLKDGGACVVVARAALAAMGHDLHVDYFPLSRTIRVVTRDDSGYHGYFPEYHHPTDKFIFSDSMGQSPLGILEHSLHPITWSRVQDLNAYTLGVVRDYVNTQELDEMIAIGAQPVELVSSDEHNIRKVATGRVQGAVMDFYVYQYLIEQPHLKGLKAKLQFNKQLLESKQLYVAFRNTPEGQRWRAIYNAGLARIQVEQILEAYLQSL
ncbi:transporter substrate-binding domain-containing protein [Shewanella insulae]|uniref:substrate-binding periplasmic protein n=1 Tax=Shewanella insulae TaxID=2681496 RepID=UPI001EFD412A|nr:transporter substrate-binding domain-containing protein [Shewanella insulae]MCG9756480.1 transporter substrate-binding domain-containing protein [Shewanella insulae]